MGQNSISINDINLTPILGKKYWKNCHREWREEFIYFLLVDRFHDNLERKPTNKVSRSSGYGNQQQLTHFYGGTIKGITKHLDYIKGLGCTALWLSPIFENGEITYHGYGIENYLNIDPRFGTKEDMQNLVEEAHARDMRVFLDIVLNHSGDTWSYPDDQRYFYYQGIRFPFGKWRKKDRPLPIELRNPEYYTRMGEIRNWDSQSEARDGDFLGFKNFMNDESKSGRELQDLLIKIHCYWIKELDVDGFRLDAAKHMGELAVARFCSHIREYAYSLNKKNFFLFGELVAGDEACNKYIGPKTSSSLDDKSIYYGLNSVLDFPLYYVLADVIKGTVSPTELINRYHILRENALNRGEYGEFLVTFIDNHDQVATSYKKRFGTDATEKQIIAGIGFLLCALGTPCIYYGTEQGLGGQGDSDCFVREAMFNKEDSTSNVLNSQCIIYQEISKIAQIRSSSPIIKFGRMFIQEISEDGNSFHFPNCSACILAFSRILFNDELIIAYNTSSTQSRKSWIKIKSGAQKTFFVGIYGTNVSYQVNCVNDTHAIFLDLEPMQFVILHGL